MVQAFIAQNRKQGDSQREVVWNCLDFFIKNTVGCIIGDTECN